MNARYLFSLVISILVYLSTGFVPPSKMITVYRKKIDFVDDRIMDLLKFRLELCKELGYYKQNNHTDTEREDQILARLCNHFDDDDFIHKIWELIFEKSKTLQL